MIMTAGLGTRLKPFTDAHPKPSLPVMGLPTIQYTCLLLEEKGIKNWVCNLHSHADLLKKTMKQVANTAQLHWSDERHHLLGSWGGIVNAKKHLKGAWFYWVNGDVISTVDYTALAKAHFELKSKYSDLEMTLLVSHSKSLKGRYSELVLDRTEGKVIDVKDIKANTHFFASSAVIERKILDRYPEATQLDFMKDYFLDAVKKKKVGFFLQEDLFWQDVGTPELWAEAHFELMKALEAEKLPKIWITKLREINRKVEAQIWAHKDGIKYLSKKVKAPFYLGPLGDKPRRLHSQLGPKAVLYGPLDVSIKTMQESFGFDSLLANFSQK